MRQRSGWAVGLVVLLVVWQTRVGALTMSLHLGRPGGTLLNGTTSWDTNTADALAIWNTVVPHCFTLDTTGHDCEG